MVLRSPYTAHFAAGLLNIFGPLSKDIFYPPASSDWSGTLRSVSGITLLCGTFFARFLRLRLQSCWAVQSAHERSRLLPVCLRRTDRGRRRTCRSSDHGLRPVLKCECEFQPSGCTVSSSSGILALRLMFRRCSFNKHHDLLDLDKNSKCWPAARFNSRILFCETS